jgi:hypothetical protein
MSTLTSVSAPTAAPTTETIAVVPLREPARAVPGFRFDASASTNLASIELGRARVPRSMRLSVRPRRRPDLPARQGRPTRLALVTTQCRPRSWRRTGRLGCSRRHLFRRNCGTRSVRRGRFRDRSVEEVAGWGALRQCLRVAGCQNWVLGVGSAKAGAAGVAAVLGRGVCVLLRMWFSGRSVILGAVFEIHVCWRPMRRSR